MRPLVKLGALAVAAAVVFAACTSVGAKGGIDVSAKFSDVGDLSPGAPVMMADITIGQVKSNTTSFVVLVGSGFLPYSTQQQANRGNQPLHKLKLHQHQLQSHGSRTQY